MILAEFGNLNDSLLKVDRFAQRFIVNSVSDDGSLTIIVDIDLNAFESSFQILKIPFDFRVTRQLIPCQIGIVRRIAKVLVDRQILIHLLRIRCMVRFIIF